MFKALMPLLAERKIHILAGATKDGNLTLYIEPVKTDDKEEASFTTPFSVQATPEELDEKLPAILGDWIAARKQVCASLTEALEASKKEMQRQADEAKKKAAERTAKKPATPVKGATGKAPAAKSEPKPAAVVTTAAPTLLDDKGGEGNVDGEDTQGGDGVAPAAATSTQTEAAAAAPVQAAASVETGETVSLF